MPDDPDDALPPSDAPTIPAPPPSGAYRAGEVIGEVTQATLLRNLAENGPLRIPTEPLCFTFDDATIPAPPPSGTQVWAADESGAFLCAPRPPPRYESLTDLANEALDEE